MQTAMMSVRLDSLALITGTGGPLDGISAICYTSPITVTPNLTYAEMDAIKATFTGSAAKTVAWGPVAVSPGDQPYQQTQLMQWVCSAAPASPQDCYGVYYFVGADLVGVDEFPAPVRIEAQYDTVQWIGTAP